MKTLIATDSRIYFDGKNYFANEKLSAIIPRYCKFFGDISLLARVSTNLPKNGLICITDILNEVIGFKNFFGLYSNSFRKILCEKIKDMDLVIGRFEGFSAIKCFSLAKKNQKPFFAEVMSDPWDGLFNHGIAGKIVAPYSYFKTKTILRKADFALYVTGKYLQSRYPCVCRSVSASNVFVDNFDESILEKRIKKISNSSFKDLTFVTVGAVYVKYKGQKYLIQSIPLFNRVGISVKYYVIGEGNQNYLKKISRKYGVMNQVVFLGKLDRESINKYLDSADFYVHPSLQEGLPRAVIEAMSRACPCLGAQTGGIPELLDQQYIFARKSPKSIFDSVLSNLSTDSMINMAKQNYERSKEFADDKISAIRSEYFEYVKETVTIKAN